ncbi:hypothetical protein SLA2020_261880 [Shorea laevis]
MRAFVREGSYPGLSMLAAPRVARSRSLCEGNASRSVLEAMIRTEGRAFIPECAGGVVPTAGWRGVRHHG